MSGDATSVMIVEQAVAKTRRFLRRLEKDELVGALRATVRAADPTSDDLAHYIMDELYRRDAELLGAVDRWAQALDDKRSQAQVVLDHYGA